MNSSQLINQTSGDYEYYTPKEIVKAARRVMGHIDIDVASSAKANEVVGARCYFDEAKDGLSKIWLGNIWMNHPFGREQNPLWINKLVEEYKAKRVKQACCITYACTSEKWFQPLFAFPQCYLSPRTNYFLPDGTLKRGVTKGSVVTYLGANVDRFIAEFDGLGSVMIPPQK